MSEDTNRSAWNFLFSENIENTNPSYSDTNESYRCSDGSGYYHSVDGSEGYRYSDGSGYYHGVDGSEGYRYSDGSGYYYGADGSEGYRYSDGSGYYYGADGSEGHIYSDGSGYYQNGNDGMTLHFSEESTKHISSEEKDSSDWLGIGTTVFGAAVIHTNQTIEKIAKFSIKANERIAETKRVKRKKFFKWVGRNWKAVTAIAFIWGSIFLILLEFMLYPIIMLFGIASKKAVIEEIVSLFSIEEPNIFLQSLFFFRIQWVFIIFILTLLIITVLIIEKISNRKKLITIGFEPEDFIGLSIDEVLKKIHTLGFTSVDVKPIRDAKRHEIQKINFVSRITIKRKKSFSRYEKCLYDIPIRVYYHAIQELSPPFSSTVCYGDDYNILAKRFEKAGFTNVIIEPIPDLTTGWITRNGSVEQVTINGEDKFKKSTRFPYDAKVVIKYHTFKKKKGPAQ